MSALGRSRIVVASSSDVMLQSLWRTSRVLCLGRDAFEFPPDYRDGAVHAAGPEAIAAFLEDLSAEVIRRTVCILDLSYEPTPLWRVVSDMHSLRPTWLAARFPEVYWIFIVRDGLVPEYIAMDAKTMHFVALNELSKLSDLLLRHAGGFRPWFDPNNLRASALLSSKSSESCMDAGLHGLVFDEEATFAAFNGYFLYRQGIPTRMVATYAEFKNVEVEKLDDTKRKYVILEDVELNYEDAPGDDKTAKLLIPKFDEIDSKLKEREIGWGLVNRDPTTSPRVFVSTLRLSGKWLSVVKPFGGLYDQSLLGHISPRFSGSKFLQNLRHCWTRLNEYFSCRCSEQQVKDSGNIASTGHSAPYAQQAVAAKLLARVRTLRASASDTVSAVHVALLALEAEILLKHNTYAMAIEALTARHVLEVVAESAFAGAADDLEVRKRIEDLKSEMFELVFHCANGWKVICTLVPWAKGWLDSWGKLHKRCVQFSNGMLECIGRLREIYQRYSKADEEEEALQEIRWWRLAVFLLKQSIPGKLSAYVPALSESLLARLARWMLWLVGILEFIGRLGCGVIWRYFIWVLRPLVLLGAITGWIFLFACLFRDVSLSAGLPGTECWDKYDWVRHSLVTFLALQQGIFGDPKLNLTPVCAVAHEFNLFATREGFSRFWNLTVMEMSLGYLHLPVFITLLIQKFTRR